MVTYATIFLSSFVIALSGALMPGPLLTATLGESARRGFWAGPLLILGHGILEAALLAALLLGLAPFLRQEGIFAVIALSGAVILLVMALGMFRSLPTLSLAWSGETAAPGYLIVSGVLMSVANPYWSVWWATIGLGYVLYCWKFGLLGIVLFFAGHILGDLFWYSLVSAAVTKGRRFLTDRLYRGLIGGCATLLVLFACFFFYTGLQKAGMLSVSW
ncbi:MAG: LysE family transporter [Deltaproteobacteria bacterium]|nr:LysE family transporter [Deltaproteobacteria bacterium]